MIHDLDIVQRLVGEEPERIDAIGVPVLSGEVDIANARLHYPGGCRRNFTASRVSPTPMRKVRFFQADGYFSIDFLAQSVVIARRVREKQSGERPIEIQSLELDREDALVAQLRAFLDGDPHARSRRPVQAQEALARAAHGAARGRRDAAPSSSPMTTILARRG